MIMNVGNQIPNLDKILRDDDESDFLPVGGSNLAAIFGLQAKAPDNCPPGKLVSKKLNVPNIVSQAIPNKTEVIIAKAVYAFKLRHNGTYISIGKLGMALTGNIATKIYQIILYKNKQEHVSVVTVTHDFVYTIQPNNYSSYYDSNKENWSILFENNDVCTEFAKEIGLARYFSINGKIENVLYQDLSSLNKDVTAKEGDNVSIKYFITTEIMQPFKNVLTTFQSMTVDISTDDNWEKTLIGCSKGLKRILFLPPNKQLSLGPGFPREKDVVIEIEITDIQTPEEPTHSHKIPSSKASIISRMAKMGQSILPKLPTSTTTDSEDTEDDTSYKSPQQIKVESSEEESQKKSSKECKEEISGNSHKVLRVMPKSDVSAINTACKPFVSSSTFTPQWSPQVQPNFVTMDGQVYSLQSQTVTPTMPTVIDPGLNMLLSETRMTNTELRMGMSKIADNVQKVLDKFHVLELQNATFPIKDRTTLDALKMLAMVTSEEKTSQPHKDTNIATDNFIQLNEMKNKVDMLENELKQSKEQVRDLETQKESLMQINENLHKTIKKLEISLKDSNTAFINSKKDVEEAKELNNKCEEQMNILENRLHYFHEKYGNVKKTASSIEAKENDNKNKEIKHIMNRIYHTLMDKFVDESYSTNFIRTTMANTIKDVTLQILRTTDEISDLESELTSTNSTETNAFRTSSIESKDSNSSYTSENITVSSVSQTDPPSIPPNDTEDYNDWLQ